MYRCVTDIGEIRKYLSDAKIVAIDIETAPNEEWRDDPKAALDAHKAHIVGVSFASDGMSDSIYVPLSHKEPYANADMQEMNIVLANLLTDSKVIKVAHNLAFESAFFYGMGIVVQPPVYDTIAAAQMTLKAPGKFRELRDCGLKALAPKLLDMPMTSYEDATGGLCFDQMNPEVSATFNYACADVDATLKLYHRLNDWFDKYLPKHRYIVKEVESPTAVYVGIMKYNGTLVDQTRMSDAGVQCERERERLRVEIASIIGTVNIGANASTKEFKQYLFGSLKLPVLKVTASSKQAADDETMVMLTEWCSVNRPELEPLFKLIQDYRRWSKTKSTYIDGYLKYVNPATGRIHADLLPLATETGRFASRNPNLQNCFDSETEILTERGFVSFQDLCDDDRVAQWQDGEIDFTKPTQIIDKPYDGDMILLRNQHIDMRLTLDHRCLLQHRKSRRYFTVSAEEYLNDDKQPHAGQYAFGNQALCAADITLLAATQADGSYNDGGVDFTFQKARKYKRLIEAIREIGAPYSEGVRKDGKVRIRLLHSETTNWLMETLTPQKVWGAFLLKLTRPTIKAILAELPHWDGCYTRGNHYSSSVKQNADRMQILSILTGSRANVREYHNGNPNSVINYQVDVTDRNYSLTANVMKTTEPYHGRVYCVTVPSGTIVVRRNGKVCITSNCPKTDGDEAGVRNFIVAPEGSVLLSLDFSQIELRVCAFYCRDERMLKTYHDGGDIHAQTTSVIYHIPQDEAKDKNAPQYKTRRTISKNCNFGVAFGLFPKGLQKTLHFKAGLDTSLAECERIIENLKNGYPALVRWQEKAKKLAAVRKYTETLLGRRRYLADITSSDRGKKAFAERCAMNTPIQGTAADILKLALGRILVGLPERPWMKPLLQIHDELVFELPQNRVSEAVTFVKACMEARPFDGFDVPIVAEAAVGQKFGEMKEVDMTDAAQMRVITDAAQTHRM